MKRKRVRLKPRFYVIMSVLLVLLILLGAMVFRALSGGTGGNAGAGRGAEKRQSVDLSARIDERISSMTLREKVMQMFLVTPESLTDTDAVTKAGKTTRRKLRKRPVGGIVYFSKNLVSKKQTREMLANTQQYAKSDGGIPLFLGVDEEGGRVARCAEKLGTAKLQPMYAYRSKGKKTAERNAKTIAEAITGLGFNLDFAPVADTWTNPRNTVIGDRAYSSDYDQAAELVAGAVGGFHAGGAACVLKHFPGHGDTLQDSHVQDAFISKSWTELKRSDLLPFRAGIRAGADMVMTSHVIDRKITDQLASLSRKMVTGILRKKMNFGGVIITDDLNMAAATSRYTAPEAAVRAVQAGNDMLLGVTDIDSSADAVVAAVKNGSVSEKQIDRSVKRILRLKVKRRIWKL